MFRPGDSVYVQAVSRINGVEYPSFVHGIVVCSRLPGKTLVDFGDVVATCENKQLCREKTNRRRG